MRARKIKGIPGVAFGGRNLNGVHRFRWRTLVPLASLYLLLFLVVAMSAEGVELDIPSMAPEGENVLPENTTIAAECLLPWNDLITKTGWVLGAPLVTQSERWAKFCAWTLRYLVRIFRPWSIGLFAGGRLLGICN